MWCRTAVGIVVVLMLGGCATSRSCTEIGCISGVYVDLPDVAPSALPARVTICADVGDGDRCRSYVVDPVDLDSGGSALVDAELPLDVHDEVEADVTVRVVAGTGEVLIDASGSGELHRSQPNGKGCEPICYQVTLTYDTAKNELVAFGTEIQGS